MIQTLQEVCSHVVDCKNRTAPEDPNGAYFAVGTPAMRGNVINYAEARKINEATFAEWTARLLPEEGDILFAREAPVGPVVSVPPGGKVAAGQRTMLLRADPEKADSDFLRLYLSAPMTQRRILALAHGSITPHLRVADVRSFPVDLPPLTEQRAIADVLCALDDKIAANAKLAAIADEWVRAGVTGLIATAEETVLVSELVANRKELAEPSTLDPASRYLGLEHLPRRSMWVTSAGTAESVTSTKAMFQRGDILFGKLRPYFHKVIVAPFDGVCSTDILVLNPASRELAGFTLASVASDLVVERATAASEGTRMPRTSWKDLASIEVPWPGLTEAKKFSAQVSGMRGSVESLLVENQTLTATRDALLPPLMSGSLRVKDAEKVLENAGV